MIDGTTPAADEPHIWVCEPCAIQLSTTGDTDEDEPMCEDSCSFDRNDNKDDDEDGGF